MRNARSLLMMPTLKTIYYYQTEIATPNAKLI